MSKPTNSADDGAPDPEAPPETATPATEKTEPLPAGTTPRVEEPAAGEPLAEDPTSPRLSPAAVFADRLDDGGFFAALFDVTFTKYVTRRLAGPVYIVGLAVIALSAIYGIITSLATAVATHSAWGVLLFLFGLLLTVVGAMLAILLLRVCIEMFVAIVAIAENTRPRGRDRR